jgi:hypothetical protein
MPRSGARVTGSGSTKMRKGAARHRYYVSSAVIQGQPEAGRSVTRVPAAKIEAVVVDAVRRHIGHDTPIELITAHVRREMFFLKSIQMVGGSGAHWFAGVLQSLCSPS